MIPTAITVDVHESDSGDDIRVASNTLAELGVRATFFVPGSLFLSRRHTSALRELATTEHEIGSHGYSHDWAEIEALIHGTSAVELNFIATAHAVASDFLGRTPKTFRAPIWCRLGAAALDELVHLEYTVDSSATPQRLMILSSRPFGRGWTLSPRSPHLLRPGLLEIPTSTLGVPAGSPAFRTLRGTFAKVMITLLRYEAKLFNSRVLTLQFDASDFTGVTLPKRKIELTDFLLSRRGGLRLRHPLQETRGDRVVATTLALVRRSAHEALSLSEIRERWWRRHDKTFAPTARYA